jgi:hypothetical protein
MVNVGLGGLELTSERLSNRALEVGLNHFDDDLAKGPAVEMV